MLGVVKDERWTNMWSFLDSKLDSCVWIISIQGKLLDSLGGHNKVCPPPKSFLDNSRVGHFFASNITSGLCHITADRPENESLIDLLYVS